MNDVTNEYFGTCYWKRKRVGIGYESELIEIKWK
jgi:hypothetical protein